MKKAETNESTTQESDRLDAYLKLKGIALLLENQANFETLPFDLTEGFTGIGRIIDEQANILKPTSDETA